jgi:hypothetical protein
MRWNCQLLDSLDDLDCPFTARAEGVFELVTGISSIGKRHGVTIGS